MAKVFPSLLAADFSRLGQEISGIKGADALHLDIMDGLFVKNISFGLPILESLRPLTKIPFDVHLMIQKPHDYIKRFADAGSNFISFHIEACPNPEPLLNEIRALGCKPGIAIDLGTSPEAILPFLPELDFVLVMSVKAGFGGQKFQADAACVIKRLAEERTRQGLAFEISVDGGINAETGRKCVVAGADILIAGSVVFRAKDPGRAIEALRIP